MELTGKDLYSARQSRSADTVEDGSILRKQRAPKHSDTSRAGNGVDEQIQPLPAEVSITVTNSGEGTAGVRKTLHNTKRNRVSYESEHDRDRQLGLPECDHGW